MPRGRIKEILHAARFGQADSRGRPRLCRGDRQNHPIAPGDWYLAIKDGLAEKTYCLVCAKAVLDQGRGKLATLVSKLDALSRNTGG